METGEEEIGLVKDITTDTETGLGMMSALGMVTGLAKVTTIDMVNALVRAIIIGMGTGPGTTMAKEDRPISTTHIPILAMENGPDTEMEMTGHADTRTQTETNHTQSTDQSTLAQDHNATQTKQHGR